MDATLTVPGMEDMKVKFEGQGQVDANTLITSLLHLTNIIHEVNRELQTNKKIEVKVNALKEGSFIVHIVIQASIIETITNLFTADNMDAAANIVTVAGGLYAVAQFFKGGKTEVVKTEDNSITVKNVEGDVAIIDNRVYNIYLNNEVIQKNIAEEFEEMGKDDSITGFSLLDKNDKPLVSIPKEDFARISELEEASIKPDDRIITKAVTLTILSLSFERNIKWTFIMEGIKLQAKIKDDTFVTLIDSGEKFAKGDALEAEIEIKQRFDKDANAYVNKGYVITKINRHLPGREQGNLFNSK